MKLKKGTLLFLLLTCLAYTASAQVVDYILQGSDVTIDGNGIITACSYNFAAHTEGTKLTIPKSVTKDSKTIIIRGIADKTTWLEGVFRYKNLVSLTFANDSEVTTIGAHAFRENQITELTLPEGLTTIELGAFYSNAITTLTLPEGLTTIEYGAFQNNKLTTLTLPTTLTTIGQSAFDNNQIATLTIPNDAQLTTIGKEAFVGNEDDGGNKITTLALPPSLETIGEKAFQNNQITTLTFPENAQLTTIGKEAFWGNQLTTLSLPPSLETIGESTFLNNSLITVTFDDDPNKSNIQRIGINAFSGNTGLTGITLPNHVGGTDVRYKDSEGNNYDPNSVDNNTFTNFTISLVVVIPPHTLTAGDVEVDGEGIITKCHCTFVSNEIIIPVQIDGKPITGIVDTTWPDKGIFQDKNLVAVVFEGGSQVISIGEQAFRNNQITELTLPTALTTIEGYAFVGNQIATLTLPTALTTIKTRAFWSNHITTLTLPTTLTTIQESAFRQNQITELTFPEDSQLATIGRSAFYLNQITTLDLPTALTSIGIDAFSNNPLPSFILPSVTIEGFRTYWKGGSSADLGTNLTILKADFTKSFERISIQQFSLTVKVNNEEGGSIEPSDDHFVVDKADPPSTQVLTAKPADGWRFDKWVISDEEDKNDKTTITLDQDKTATAHFVQLVTLTTAVAEQQGGTISANPNPYLDNQYDIKTEVTLTATPADGWRFDKWVISDEQEKTDKITTITLNTDKTATAHFVKLISLTLIIQEGGEVDGLNEGVNTRDKGKETVLNAIPESGYRFVSWTIGEQTIQDNPYTLPASDTDVSVTVAFEVIPQDLQVTLTIAKEGEGSLTPDEGTSILEKGTTATLTATPQDGWRFDKWVIGTEERTDNPTSINLDGNKLATAYFVQLVTLTTSVEGQQGGTISATPNPSLDTRYDIETEVSLTATPDQGWRFDKWVIGTEERTDNPTSINLDGNKSATAHFVQLVTLTTSVEGQQGGSISRSPDMDTYNINTEVSLTATPDQGWRFDKWVIGTEERTDNPTSITLDKNKSVTAHFVEAVTLTVKVNNEDGGSIEPSDDHFVIDKADAPSTQALTAKPNEGWRFDKWVIGSEDITDNPTTITLDQDKTATAHFVEIVTLTVEVNNEDGGSIEPSDDHFVIDKADAPSTQALTAKPNEGWRFDKWVIGSEDITDNPTTITLDQDKTATAHFVKEEEEEAITSILTEVVSANPYPNPVTSQITLKAKDGDLIQLFSPKGKQQYSTQHTGNEVHTIDVSALPVGVYLVRITDAEGNTTTKRIVKK